MVLPIRKYGDPVLRQKGALVETITPAITQLIRDMFETMYAAKGLGLAAQQIGRAIQLTVLDVRGADRPSTLELQGQPAQVDAFMPLVLINPVITPTAPPATGSEGCLSFPEVFADITRPDGIEVKALDAEGKPVHFRCTGLLAKAIQHEHDHLHGLLFIDRMSLIEKQKIQEKLDALVEETRAATKKKRR